MNCEDFSSIVNELAENRPMDATARVNGLAHAAMCAECSMRLSDAKNVSAGLRIARAAETEETPARVKESLLAAFAQHHAEHHKIAASPLIFTPASKRSSRRTLGWWSAAAVAAAAVVILALMLSTLMRVASPVPPTQTAGNQGQPLPVVTAPTPPPEVPKSLEPERQATVAKNNSPVAPSKRPTLARKAPRANATNQNETETVAKSAGNQYIPLTYLASATAMESGTVVRIQLSRSKLISLGLPLNGERADELLKADLVLGDDGVARAIRLVNE
jgi:hypothetical protein